MKRVAISQSNYLPWRGYFHVIGSVDEFVLYDEVQYTKRDWRNRNVIKTVNGPAWLTVPVRVKGRFEQRIDDTMVADSGWASAHWTKLTQAYSTAPCFADFAPRFSEFYASVDHERLSDINRQLTELIMSLIGIDTALTWSTDYPVESTGQTERLVSICEQAGATEYWTGPAAAAYLDHSIFDAAGVRVHYVDYSILGEYPQLHGPFVSQVSVVDTLFNVGHNTSALIGIGKS